MCHTSNPTHILKLTAFTSFQVLSIKISHQKLLWQSMEIKSEVKEFSYFHLKKKKGEGTKETLCNRATALFVCLFRLISPSVVFRWLFGCSDLQTMRVGYALKKKKYGAELKQKQNLCWNKWSKMISQVRKREIKNTFNRVRCNHNPSALQRTYQDLQTPHRPQQMEVA